MADENENQPEEREDSEEAQEQPQQEEAEEASTDWEAEAKKWKKLARQHETRSKQNADKAKQFDEAEESRKSELQKAEDRAQKAEAEAAEHRTKALRAEVASDKGVPALLLSGTTQEELEASADKLLEFRDSDNGKKAPDLKQGQRGAPNKSRQLNRDDMKRMNSQEIVTARREGRMDDLLAGRNQS